MSRILTVTLQILAIILGSGALSAFLTHFLTTGVAEKNFRREKLEQLYLAAVKFTHDSADYALLFRKTEQPSEDEFKDFQERRKDYDRLFDSCTMLTNLYFPHLGPALETFGDYWEKFVFRTTAVTENDLRQSGAKLVAQNILTARQMNRPWYLTLKDWFTRRSRVGLTPDQLRE